MPHYFARALLDRGATEAPFMVSVKADLLATFCDRVRAPAGRECLQGGRRRVARVFAGQVPELPRARVLVATTPPCCVQSFAILLYPVAATIWGLGCGPMVAPTAHQPRPGSHAPHVV